MSSSAASSDIQTNCRYFSGYKPCGKNEICSSQCSFKDLIQTRILIVHLEALGAVVRATCILPAIKRKFPNSHITWVTQKPADQILKHNMYLDRVLTTEVGDLLSLSALEFDVGFCIDKSLKAAGVLKQTHCDIQMGFQVEAHTGAIIPCTLDANELWQTGLSNHHKFFVNKKTENQLITEALGLTYQMDEPQMPLSQNQRQSPNRGQSQNIKNDEQNDEHKMTEHKKDLWSENGKKIIVGLNTGCSQVISYKKLTVKAHRELIELLLKNKSLQVVLLGGKEDKERNQEIANGLDVISSATDLGIREGLTSVAACDIVVSGDSFGMHMAIAQKKWVVAWFGPTCAHEIELYGRGKHIISNANCSPCWKRTCQKQVMCYDLVDLKQIVSGVNEGIEWHHIQKKYLLSKQPSLETCF